MTSPRCSLHRAALVIALGLAAGCGEAALSDAPGAVAHAATVPLTLFLNFDGATITHAATPDAARDQCEICAAVVPPFDHRPFGDDRQAVIDAVAATTAGYFDDFNLRLTTSRPPGGPYHMVMVGGTPALCGRADGIGGLAPLDCDNASAADVAFVFAQPITALAGIALSIAHETGHVLGLPHNTEPCDTMSNLLCPGGGDKRFLDLDMDLAPDHQGRCGLAQTNSYRLLERVLGRHPLPPADAGPGDAGPGDAGPGDASTPVAEAAVVDDDTGVQPAPPGGGCALAGRPFSAPLLPLFLLVFSLCCRRSAAREPLSRSRRSTSDGHPGRDLFRHW